MSKLTQEEEGRLVLSQKNVTQEQGVSFFERMVLKTMANDPEKAKLWLRRRGHQVQPYGDGFNFAVRSSDEEPWRVVDPEGFDMNDVLADFLPEMAAGALTELGRVAGGAAAGAAGLGSGGPVGAVGGGLAGQAAGAGLAGAATDLLLQELGVLAGVNTRIDPVQTAAVGGISAALPGAGRLGRKALTSGPAKALGRKAIGAVAPAARGAAAVGREAVDVLGRFAGFPEEFFLSARDSLIRTARQLRTPKPTLKGAVDLTRKILDKVSAKKFPESVKLDRLLRGKRIDVSDEIEAIARVQPSRASTADGVQALSNLREDILTTVGLAAGRGTDPVTGRSLPVIVDGMDALQLKRLFQNITDDARIWTAKRVPKTKNREADRVFGAWQTLRDKLRIATRQKERFDALNETMERKLRSISGLERFLGKGTSREVVLESLAEGELATPTSFFRGAFTDIGEGRLSAIRSFDDAFKKDLSEVFRQAAKGTDVDALIQEGLLEPNIEDLARTARIQTAFPGGEPGIIPPLAATGSIRSAAALSSLLPMGALSLGGGMLGGPLGALAGFSIASPRMLAETTRAALLVGAGAKRAVGGIFRTISHPAATEAQKAAAFTALQNLARESVPEEKPVLREDAKRKELSRR